MKLSYVAGLLGLTASIDRRDVGDLAQSLPACSLSCFHQAAQTFNCDPHDISCRCSKEVQMTATMERCLQRSCSDHHKAITENLSHEICNIQLQNNMLYKKSAEAAPAPAPAPVPAIPDVPVVPDFARRAPEAVASFPVIASSIPASSIAPFATSTATPAPVVTAGAAAVATPVAMLAVAAALGAIML
ncbi:cfem domain containing protein [Grosmannia clavigera kw1407]|uniref:Cfem domain containing protein n=3 Tax=Ophiostomataceae TaxID=5152 RepID=F0XJQ1_GROCL|nr:cfem domain containing protein [Grosmannia clavigera kw1407]EFX02040.1 cfem domain containing protein [Grosmannia clavigera kw1407]